MSSKRSETESDSEAGPTGDGLAKLFKRHARPYLFLALALVCLIAGLLPEAMLGNELPLPASGIVRSALEVAFSAVRSAAVLGGLFALIRVNDLFAILVSGFNAAKQSGVFSADVVKALAACFLFGCALALAARIPEKKNEASSLVVSFAADAGVLALFRDNASVARVDLGAALDSARIGRMYIPAGMWKQGVAAATDSQVVARMLSRADTCARLKDEARPVIIEVSGHASSREFRGDSAAQQASDALNALLAYHRGVHLWQLISRQVADKHSFLVKPPEFIEGRDNLARAATYVDRLGTDTLIPQEQLLRRAEARIVRAPGCLHIAGLSL